MAPQTRDLLPFSPPEVTTCPPDSFYSNTLISHRWRPEREYEVIDYCDGNAAVLPQPVCRSSGFVWSRTQSEELTGFIDKFGHGARTRTRPMPAGEFHSHRAIQIGFFRLRVHAHAHTLRGDAFCAFPAARAVSRSLTASRESARTGNGRRAHGAKRGKKPRRVRRSAMSDGPLRPPGLAEPSFRRRQEIIPDRSWTRVARRGCSPALPP